MLVDQDWFRHPKHIRNLSGELGQLSLQRQKLSVFIIYNHLSNCKSASSPMGPRVIGALWQNDSRTDSYSSSTPTRPLLPPFPPPYISSLLDRLVEHCPRTKPGILMHQTELKWERSDVSFEENSTGPLTPGPVIFESIHYLHWIPMLHPYIFQC